MPTLHDQLKTHQITFQKAADDLHSIMRQTKSPQTISEIQDVLNRLAFIDILLDRIINATSRL